MDHVDDGGDNNDVIEFVYMGGVVPQHLRETITHVRVHISVKIIRSGAFMNCRNLVSIEMHDDVEIIEDDAFLGCWSLRGIKLPGVRVIGEDAFQYCTALVDVKFGDKLETIEASAFYRCTSLRNIKIPKVRVIRNGAFAACERLMEVELSKDLERIEDEALAYCPRLRRIAMPLKGNIMFGNEVFINCVDLAFDDCASLSQIDLIGGIHKTVSSLLLDSWRNEINDVINEINHLLPNTTTDEKTRLIRHWMERVIYRITHYKSEHYTLLKSNITQLELALWKSNLPNIDAAASRDEARFTCGANIIIPHVLSFLNDADEFPILDYGQH